MVVVGADRAGGDEHHHHRHHAFDGRGGGDERHCDHDVGGGDFNKFPYKVIS